MVADHGLVKTLAFDGKHKISDRFNQDFFTVTEQLIPGIPMCLLRKNTSP